MYSVLYKKKDKNYFRLWVLCIYSVVFFLVPQITQFDNKLVVRCHVSLSVGTITLCQQKTLSQDELWRHRGRDKISNNHDMLFQFVTSYNRKIIYLYRSLEDFIDNLY